MSRDPDFISTEYGSALELALKKKNNAALKILIDHGANVNAVITTYEETPLMLAVDYGNVEAVQLLLDGNANVNAQEWGGGTAEGPSAHSHSGRSDFIRRRRGFFAYIAKPLAIAILQESTREIDPHLIIIASILSGGADPNIQTVYGDTPLIVAVRHELEEAVELLVAAGADIHKKNPDGESAMDMIRRSSVSHRLEHIMRNPKSLKDISF